MTIRDEKWLAQWSEATEVARERLDARRKLSGETGIGTLSEPASTEPLKIMTVPHRTPKPKPEPKPMSTRTHAMLLAGFTFLFFLPSWLLPALAFTTLLLALTSWTILGQDRINAMVAGYYSRVRERDEARAEHLRQRAAATSAWFANVIAALPESWTRGLYLPDFEVEDDPHEKLSEDPFERLYSDASMPMH